MSGNPPWIWSSPAEGPPDPALLGGKGAGLARLQALGLPVPPFFVVTTEARRGATARPPLPAALADAIARATAARFGPATTLAVRSSAAGEDAAGHSFAGIHESILGVRGGEAVLAALDRVWASASSERALAYRRERGLPLAGIEMGAVVQAAVEPRSSGVVFTRDPATGDPGTIVVGAVLGLGEGLVGGALDADTFRVRRPDLAILEARVVPKEERFVLDPGAGGTRREPVPGPERGRPSLTEEQAQAAARAALEIEASDGRAQDVEFAFDGEGRLWILQARPVTAAGPAAAAAPPRSPGGRLLWDNSNIIESYAGVTTPMTFSFIRRAYAIVYQVFAETMGVPRGEVRRSLPVFENMLGLFRGRVYYNLRNWYRLIRLFPGYAFNRRFMEGMMGVKEPLEEDAGGAPSFLRRWLVELPSLLLLVLRSGGNFLRLPRLVARFRARFEACLARWTALDLDRLAPHELLALHREMEGSVLWRWKAPIVNDFFVMIAYGTLRRLCARWASDATGSLANGLLCGEPGIESAEPARRLVEIAAEARKDPALRERILRGDPAALAREVPGDPRFAPLAAGVGRYLADFGFRSPDELKLESETLRDNPAFVYQILQNHLAADDAAFAAALGAGGREARIRAEAERQAADAIRGRRLGGARLLVFRRVLAAARRGVRDREAMRLARARAYAIVRDVVRAAGRRLAEAGALDAPQDIFWLGLDEVWDYVKGTALTTDLKALAALRRREFEEYSRDPEPPDPRFETEGLPYVGNAFRKDAPPAPAGAVLRGVGCSPGTVEGPVKVIRSPSADARLQGEILAAERTDPGWVPLFPSASGILVERGSLLSHSAIVAREMGIPTVVGIPGLLKLVQTGDRVRMDGAAGTVERLPRGIR